MGVSHRLEPFSRKAYSEVVYRQTTNNFLAVPGERLSPFRRCAPKRLVIDNLKAAVLEPIGTTRRYIPSYSRSPTHYGTVILPDEALHAQSTKARSRVA